MPERLERSAAQGSLQGVKSGLETTGIQEVDAIEYDAASDDPWKGKFGGASVSNERELTAAVQALPNSSYYEVRLKVKSTNKNNPLKGDVYFYLHPTFPKMRVRVPADGKSESRLL